MIADILADAAFNIKLYMLENPPPAGRELDLVEAALSAMEDARVALDSIPPPRED